MSGNPKLFTKKWNRLLKSTIQPPITSRMTIQYTWRPERDSTSGSTTITRGMPPAGGPTGPGMTGSTLASDGAMGRRTTPIVVGVPITGGTDRITPIHTIRILHPTDTMGWGTTDTVNLFSIRRAGSTGHGIPGMSERQGCGVRTGA